MSAPPDRHPDDSRERQPRLRVTQESDAIVVIGLEGEFDLASSPRLSQAAAQALDDDNDLIVDLSEAAFIDSSVINVLFDLKTAAKSRGLAAVLEAGTEAIVDRVLDVATVENGLPRSRSRADAVQMIQRLRATPVSGGPNEEPPTLDL